VVGVGEVVEGVGGVVEAAGGVVEAAGGVVEAAGRVVEGARGAQPPVAKVLVTTAPALGKSHVGLHVR